MKNLKQIMDRDPYSFKKVKKENLLKEHLQILNNHHYNKCKKYKKLVDNFALEKISYFNTQKFPMIPVKIFKLFDLMSIKKKSNCKKNSFIRYIRTRAI